MNIDINREFAQIDSTGNLVYSPRTLLLDGHVYVSPSAARYAEAGWLPIQMAAPNPPSGKCVKATRYEISDGHIAPVYEYGDASVQVIVSKSKVEAAVDRMGKTTEFIAWLNSRAVYVGAWTRGGDTIVYDQSDDNDDLTSLVAALGIAEAEVPALIAEVTV